MRRAVRAADRRDYRLPLYRTVPVQEAHCVGAGRPVAPRLSSGTAAAITTRAARGLDGFLERVRDNITASAVAGFDETRFRVAGLLHWVHCARAANTPCSWCIPAAAWTRWKRRGSCRPSPGSPSTTPGRPRTPAPAPAISFSAGPLRTAGGRRRGARGRLVLGHPRPPARSPRRKGWPARQPASAASTVDPAALAPSPTGTAALIGISQISARSGGLMKSTTRWPVACLKPDQLCTLHSDLKMR